MRGEDSINRARGGLGRNPVRTRDHNRRVILDLLRQHSPLRRKALAEATQLSAPAIANILEGLLAEGLILDMGRRKPSRNAGRGQPPLHFALNPRGAHTLGFEIGVRGVLSVMLDLVGEPRDQRILATGRQTPEAVMALLRAEIARAATMDAGPLLGVGIVLPDALSIEGLTGAADPTTLTGWEAMSAARMSEALQAPVWMENDANAAALSEALFGAAAQLSDVAVLYFGEGLGLGALNARQLIRGARGHAGEIGHIVLVPGGKPCACGQCGCAEQYISRHALSAALGAALDRGTVVALWEARDPRLLSWIAEAGGHLSQIVGMVENLFDPESIVICGQLPAPVLAALIEATPLRPSVSAHAARAVPRLTAGQSGIFTAALGAAALPFYGAMSPQGDPDAAERAGGLPKAGATP